MENLELVIPMIDEMLDTKRKRRIIVGILMSASLFFRGLVLATITIKTEEMDYE